jgi:hypothetical protein
MKHPVPEKTEALDDMMPASINLMMGLDILPKNN